MVFGALITEQLLTPQQVSNKLQSASFYYSAFKLLRFPVRIMTKKTLYKPYVSYVWLQKYYKREKNLNIRDFNEYTLKSSEWCRYGML